jgi:hypothetical protein
MAAALEVGRRPGSRWQRVTPPVLLAGGVLLASVALHLRDPHQSGSWGFCPWLVLTGTYCPGCGGLRAVNDLTRGDLAAAASSNLLFVSSIPLLVFFWGRWLRDGWAGVRRAGNSRRASVYAALFSAVALAFWVVRNLPAGSWLAP